ncbi:TPA: alpha-1,2-fucosyltransferase [Vibrio cholerae]
MSSKVVYAQGGLGNQLFQYAFLKFVQYKFKCVGFDMGRVVYDAQHSGVDIRLLLNPSCKVLESNNKKLSWLVRDDLLCRMCRLFLRKLSVNKIGNYIYDYDANIKSSKIDIDECDIFVGYFQSVDYAIYSKSIIEMEISEKHSDKLKKYSDLYSQYTAIHIRRGDFCTSKNKKHPTFSVQDISSVLSGRYSRVVFFSDDINWCRNNFGHMDGLIFHSGGNAIDDFLAMTQCKNYILFGSTFSWWAAFLFSDKQTKVDAIYGCDALFFNSDSLNKLGWKIHSPHH